MMCLEVVNLSDWERAGESLGLETPNISSPQGDGECRADGTGLHVGTYRL